MDRTYDVIIIGLGGMGSAAAYQLTKRGMRVLGLERFTLAHDRGSSHGGSRITRTAYFEDPAYVPLLLRSHELWREIEHETGEDILTMTGGLMMGPESSRTVAGSLETARTWELRHEMLNAAEINLRYPAFTPASDVVGLYEEEAGFVRPELSVMAHCQAARIRGAELHFGEAVRAWKAAPSGDGVTVSTDQATYSASRLVITPGAWAPELLADLDLPLQVERYVQFWFEPEDGIDRFLADRHPIYIWEAEDGVQFYGFPAHKPFDAGIKVAFFRLGSPTTPETVDRTVHPGEIQRMRMYIGHRIPALNGRFLNARTCLYTTTPDTHFVISLHPEHPQVAIAAGFSGHGFKFVPVVGEIMADLAADGHTKHSIDLFDPIRDAVTNPMPSGPG